MISRYRASLNGVQLDSLHKDLLILDIGYSGAMINITPERVANLDGFDYKNPYAEKQTVTITFELHIYDVKKRNEAWQKINTWAKAGGTLAINDREGQHLEAVRCEQFPAIGSVRNWTDPLTIVFATTYNPYWVSDVDSTITLIGISTRGIIKPSGNAGSSLVSALVTTDAPVSSFQIVVGSTNIRLTGLSLLAGQRLSIDYLKGRYMRILENNRSAMHKMAPSSSDNLRAVCGENNVVSINANNRVTAVVIARGLWL